MSKSYKLRKLEKRERRLRDKMLNNRENNMINSHEINDQLTVRKAIFPLWVFADVNQAKWCKYPYWCFVGCNYPDGIQLKDEDKYRKMLQYITSGDFIAACDKVDPKPKKGWANAATPDEAFKDAIRMAGYFAVTKESA